MRRIVGNFDRMLVLGAALLLGGCDKTTRPRLPEEQMPTNSIAYLKSLCNGRSSRVVTEEITVRGFITANDLYGEFYKTLVMEDASGGITVAADLGSVAAACPFGYVATLRCQGLVLTEYGGKIQIGTASEGTGSGRIPEEDFDRYVSVEAPAEDDLHRARTITLGELSEEWIDTRVRIDGVRFTQPGAMWCDIDPESGETITTERTFVDAQGRSLAVRTAAGCSYAKEPVPSGTGSLLGILDCFNGKFSLRITNRDILFPGNQR